MSNVTLRLSQWPGYPEVKELLGHQRLLELLPEAADWDWTLGSVETGGGPGTRLVERWSDEGRTIPGRRFLRVTRCVPQFIWGDLLARLPGTDETVMRISAIDSTYYEIEGRPDLVERLRTAFASAMHPSTSN